MKFLKFTVFLLLLTSISFNLFSQSYDELSKQENNNKAITYNVNTSIGGDDILASLKIEIIGDNLQIYRNIGTNNWDYQYYNWSEHPGRGIHLYIGGNFYYVDYSTDIYLDGIPSASNLSYFEDSDGDIFDRVDITRDDDYNATVKLLKANVVEALLTINYPPESDYINYKWEITNISGSDMNDLRFFQEGDTYSYGSDFGVGYWDGPTNTVGCQKMDNGEIVSVYLQSLELPFQHESARYGFYSGVESHVMANALTGEVLSTSHDNAIALEWRKSTLTNEETWTIHTIEKYSDKDITNIIVTAPLNETIFQGETKYLIFNVKNNTLNTVSDIVLNELIDLPDWTINVVDPVGAFELLPNESISVSVSVYCPLSETPGVIAKATLQAIANSETADDKSYLEVLSILPSLNQQPVDQDVCSESDAVIFFISSDNTGAYQWQKNTGTWTNIINGGVFSGVDTDTLRISDVTGLIGTEFRCFIANGYGDAMSNSATIVLDHTAPVPDAISLPDIISQCEVSEYNPPTATDECEGIVVGESNVPFPIKQTTHITWTFEDSNGNKSYLVQDIIINDISAPVPDLTTLPPITKSCNATITNLPTATDNCNGQITATTTDPLSYNELGSYLITWTYADSSSNTVSQDQTINIVDNNPVVETKDTTITIPAQSTNPVIITPEDINNGSSDDCGIDSMYLDITNFTVEDEGENIVNLTIVDFIGNHSTKSAIVTIILDYTLLIPNFISPDNDGKNDYWEIKGLSDLEGYTLNIFNNIGGNVYHSDNYDNTWNATYNGKELPDGTYYYIFKLGENTHSGFISVVR